MQKTLEAWTYGDEKSKVSAVFRGGTREWAVLWKDDSYTVRGAIAYFANEEYQLKLVYDPITPVRERLAIYGTDKVRLALLERDESDEEVVKLIAKFGNTTVRHWLVQVMWDKPDILYQCVRYLPASDLEKLLAHPRMDIRVEAALHGNYDQCRRALAMSSASKDVLLFVMQDDLFERMRELEEVDKAINFGKTITRKKQEMELST
ncbi:hypothetical protein [Acutalibacter muris]|uniref:hypothetical protein n=1 Tax=Acutalibacter muris TaxID=1796620 RepID=UPI001C3EBA5A|nr:hypothetical protein [Acutalibacter muris]